MTNYSTYVSFQDGDDETKNPFSEEAQGWKLISCSHCQDQRFGSVIFFTDPDPTQKPKADPDPGEILHARI